MNGTNELQNVITRSVRQLADTLCDASEFNCRLIESLNEDLLHEYEEQLEVREEAASPRMPSLATFGERWKLEGEDSCGLYFPIWCAPFENGDGNFDLERILIEPRTIGADYTFDALRCRTERLRDWELFLVWKYELRVRPYRESLRKFQRLVELLDASLEAPLDESIPPIEFELSSCLNHEWYWYSY